MRSGVHACSPAFGCLRLAKPPDDRCRTVGPSPRLAFWQANCTSPHESRLRLVASRDGRHGSVTIWSDADVHLAAVQGGAAAHHALRPGRRAWVHVVCGELRVDGQTLLEGDGAGFVLEAGVFLFGRAPLSDVLLVDLADGV